MYTKEQLQSVNSMNKATLREACKAAAIKGYGKMTVAQMRSSVQRHIEREMKKAAPVVTTATTVERTVQNGVRRPLPESACGLVWAALDAMLKAGIEPATKDVRDLSTAKGWNESNSICELSAWRKHMGLSKQRPTKPGPRRKSAAKLAAPATLVDASQPAA